MSLITNKTCFFKQFACKGKKNDLCFRSKLYFHSVFQMRMIPALQNKNRRNLAIFFFVRNINKIHQKMFFVCTSTPLFHELQHVILWEWVEQISTFFY